MTSHPPSSPPAGAEAGDFDQIAPRFEALRQELARVIVGQDEAVQALLLALLCRGHVLIVGVPGLAKTLLVRTLARATALPFRRIQFTPDMMPADVTGSQMLQEDPATGQRHLELLKGPIFAQLVLADEINRSPPKTQAALLEAMAEHQVTVAGQTLPLEDPFLVVATQNPIEQAGTYPLPEAQLDRFMFCVNMQYPPKAQEKQVVSDGPAANESDIEPVVDGPTVQRFADAVAQMPIADHVVDYAVSLARATRPDDAAAPEAVRHYVAWGAGPRAGQALAAAAKASAAMAGEPSPGCDHIRAVAGPVLRHRLVLSYTATAEHVTDQRLVEAVLDHVPEPSAGT
jgi:MoxR-like ATPase